MVVQFPLGIDGLWLERINVRQDGNYDRVSAALVVDGAGEVACSWTESRGEAFAADVEPLDGAAAPLEVTLAVLAFAKRHARERWNVVVAGKGVAA